MPSVKLTRSNAVAPAALNEGDRAPLGDFCAGTELIVRCRYAEAYINPTTAPVALQWEGPYLRIYPGFPDIFDRAATNMGKKIGMPNEAYAVSGGTINPVGPSEPFYEIDAIQAGAIYLPFPARVELYTALSGAWLFDYVSWQNLQQKEVSARAYPQTRTIRTGQAARFLEVPLGCREFSFSGVIGAAGGLPQVDAEQTGKTVGNGSSQFPVSGLTGPGPLDRYPILGGRTFVLNDPLAAGNTPGAVTFWCYF